MEWLALPCQAVGLNSRSPASLQGIGITGTMHLQQSGVPIKAEETWATDRLLIASVCSNPFGHRLGYFVGTVLGGPGDLVSRLYVGL